MLGALFAVILAWPFCCAALPIPATTTPTILGAANVTTLTEFHEIILLNTSAAKVHEPINYAKTATNTSAVAVLSRTERSFHAARRKKQRDLDRNERSANLSHITGATRKIQLYIKNRFLQLLPDGTVNGTHDDMSDFSK